VQSVQELLMQSRPGLQSVVASRQLPVAQVPSRQMWPAP
jgi:hypothetical protein